MRRVCWIAVSLIACSAMACARKHETVEELKARIERATPDELPDLCAAIASREVDAAGEAYAGEKPDAGRQQLDDAVTYAEKARDAAIQSRKRLKRTEIAVRKMASRVREIKRNANFEDQPPIQTAIDHLERVRTDLLAAMFGSKEDK